MNNEFTLTKIIAPQPLACFRCIGIGIPDDTIQNGEMCIEIDHNGEISFACVDCFDRLEEQVG